MSETKLITGNEVFNLISSSIFVDQWKHLALSTKGFTKLQEPEFVITWYSEYMEEYEPVLIITMDAGLPIAMMCLAWDKNRDILTHAGEKNAEYHGWLSKSGVEIQFLEKALILVRQKFSITQWKWGWIPPGFDGEQLRRITSDGIFANVEQRPSLIWDLTNPQKLQKTKKNRSFRSKYNRLKKRGNIKFRIISCPKELGLILETASSQCDFRQEAINDIRPFADNPKKIPFNAALLKYPGTIHASGIWLDDKLLAFHFGICDDKRVCLGTSSYDPSESKYSPGSLLMVELADSLTEQGFEILDLTPGTDGYKERYANDSQELYRPSFYFSAKSIIKARVKYTAINVFLKILPILKLNLHFVKNWTNRLGDIRKMVSNLGLLKFFQHIFKGLYSVQKLSLYQINSETKDLVDLNGVNVNMEQYEDLLCYKEVEPWASRRDLLKEAIEKFANGESLLSALDGDSLSWLGWIGDAQKTITLKGVSMKIDLGVTGFVFYDFFNRDKDSSCQNIKKSLSLFRNAGQPVYLLLESSLNDSMDIGKLRDSRLIKKMTCFRILWLFKFYKEKR